MPVRSFSFGGIHGTRHPVMHIPDHFNLLRRLRQLLKCVLMRTELIERLTALPDVTVTFWKDSDLLCVFHKDKEIAHFQNESEIDIRLTPKLIQQKRLQPPPNTTSHPDRSKRSRWLVQSFTKESLDHIVDLVQEATQL